MTTAPQMIDIELLHKYAVAGPRYTSYPPAPMFHETFGWRDYLQALAATNARQRPLSLYVHLPFCRSLCWYCGCTRIITHKPAKIRDYVLTLTDEIRLLRDTLAGDRPVLQLHWGGGSPSYLAQADKTVLMQVLQQHFHFSTEAELGIELDPRDVQPGDAEALRQLGFNRVSVGIQDCDPAVQRAINRLHSVEQIRELIGQLRAAGFSSINVDVMYGLPLQRLETFAQTIHTISDLHPDRIALFNFAYLPALLKHQRLINPDALPAPKDKLSMLKMAIETLTAEGYVYIGMDHFALPEDELCLAQQHKTLTRNFQGYSTQAGCDLLAFGCSAISQLGPVYAQNQKTLREYAAAVTAGIPATARGYRLSRDDEIRQYAIQQIMCHLGLSKAALLQHWGIHFDTYFAAEIADLQHLEHDGLVEITPAAVQVTELGRLLVRNIAMVFDAYRRRQGQKTPLYSRTV
jgi:oxygen-independent coproporphyrinogen-3 oxidase